MSHRSYKQHCSLARALDIVGERWTLLLVRELLIGPRRYRDLLKNLEGIGTNLLADRLKEMEHKKLIEKIKLAKNSKTTGYQLTSLGRDLEPIVNELVRWGFQFLGVKNPDDLSRPEWDFVAIKAFFRPELSKGLDATFLFKSGDLTSHMIIKNGALTVNLGTVENPTTVISGSKETLTALFTHESTIKEAESENLLKIEGNRKTVTQLINCFQFPRI